MSIQLNTTMAMVREAAAARAAVRAVVGTAVETVAARAAAATVAGMEGERAAAATAAARAADSGPPLCGFEPHRVFP